MTEKGMRIEHNVACSRNLHCLNSLWFVTKWVPSIDTYLNWTGGGAIDTLPYAIYGDAMYHLL